MSEEQFWVIQTEDLQIGTTLSFDLMDASGMVLHKAGMPINVRLKERLRAKSIHSVTVRGAAKFGGTQLDALLIDSFSPGSVKAIQEAIESTQIAVRNLVAVLKDNKEGNIDELRENVIQFVGQASKDVAAGLAVIAMNSRGSNCDIIEIVAKRSAKLSLLGVITSVLNSDEPNESMEIGLAGLLHDCSLLLHPEWFSIDTNQRGDSFLNEYQRHPIESAELLYSAPGISKNTITMVTQVHEQADGTGYPRGMTLANTLQGAAILNLADAYLTLVEPIRGNGHVHVPHRIDRIVGRRLEGTRHSGKSKQAISADCSVAPTWKSKSRSSRIQPVHFGALLWHGHGPIGARPKVSNARNQVANRSINYNYPD